MCILWQNFGSMWFALILLMCWGKLYFQRDCWYKAFNSRHEVLISNTQHQKLKFMIYCLYGFLLPIIMTTLISYVLVLYIDPKDLAFFFEGFDISFKLISIGFFIVTFLIYRRKTRDPILQLNQTQQRSSKVEK